MSAPNRTLWAIRRRIDRVDEKVVRLLARRAALVDELTPLKARPADPRREREVLRRIRLHASSAGADPCPIAAVYRMILKKSRKRQRRRHSQPRASK
jgi:chorismate mutase